MAEILMTDDPIERAIAYVSTLDPGFAERIRGASPEEIDALERAMGRPLHPRHRRFLERFGTGPNGLDLGPVDVRAATLREALEVSRGAMPEGVSLFGVSGEDPYFDLVLIDRGEEPEIASVSTFIGADFSRMTPEMIKPAAGSIAELICLPPTMQHRYEPMPLKALFVDPRNDDGAISRLQRTIGENELRTAWFSSAITQVVEMPSTVIIAQRRAPNAMGVVTGSTSRIELAAVHWWLTHDVGLEPRPLHELAS
ncbi:MAG TPA: SMI1/KNR4 family protein [Thermoanaerobaculia bacterium]|nr:SMI1/KNR4 family protein [Thermoanaerobaculia bacterium]